MPTTMDIHCPVCGQAETVKVEIDSVECRRTWLKVSFRESMHTHQHPDPNRDHTGAVLEEELNKRYLGYTPEPRLPSPARSERR